MRLIIRQPSSLSAFIEHIRIYFYAKCKQVYYHACIFYRFSTVRFTADIMKVRSFGSYRAFALELYENVLDSCRSSLIICHVFSMNGCSVFCALWDLIDTLAEADRIKAKIGGVIYDRYALNFFRSLLPLLIVLFSGSNASIHRSGMLFIMQSVNDEDKIVEEGK